MEKNSIGGNMTHNDLEIDLVFNNLTDDILKELESLGQLPPNQYWLTPDASSDNTITDNISELNNLLNQLTADHNATKTDLATLTSNYNKHNHDSSYVKYTKNTSIIVAGNTKDTYTYNQTAIYAPNGLIMGGTAAQAGLITRGICGVSTPGTGGAATKDNLFLNYDGANTYNASRQVIIQAGEIGSHYGNNLYQYCAARGDSVKNYCDTTYANKSHTHSYLPSSGGTMSGPINMNKNKIEYLSSIMIKGLTSNNLNYDSVNPYIEFINDDSQQSAKLIFTDYNVVNDPATLALVGGPGEENVYFQAPNIKVTGTLYIS
jgi:hypothetical protein